ncbi:hypothetical protein J6590_086370 [Homalodisca vitripennis]|nr:hypothetical protein J6590_086370 [Homalodisca vitripennis]
MIACTECSRNNKRSLCTLIPRESVSRDRDKVVPQSYRVARALPHIATSPCGHGIISCYGLNIIIPSSPM